MGRSILWTVLFLAVLAVSAFGLLILLVTGKEGGETWQLAAGVGVFFVLLVIWWNLAPGFAGGYSRTLALLGKAVLTALFLFFTVMATPYVLASIQGPRLEKKVAIENFKETFIEWPGFAGRWVFAWNGIWCIRFTNWVCCIPRRSGWARSSGSICPMRISAWTGIISWRAAGRSRIHAGSRCWTACRSVRWGLRSRCCLRKGARIWFTICIPKTSCISNRPKTVPQPRQFPH